MGKYPGPLSTPAYHAGALFLLDRAGKVRCLDAASGAKRWVRDVDADADLFGFKSRKKGGGHGPEGSSPLTVAGKVILNGHRACVALDPMSGKTQWLTVHADKPHGPFNGSFITPIVWGEDRIILSASGIVHCLRVGDGAHVWCHDAKPSSLIADPVAVPDSRLFHCTAYGRRSFVLDLGGDDRELVWSNNALVGNKIASAVARDGLVFGFGAGGTGKGGLGCVDATDGKLLWQHSDLQGRVIRIGDALLVQQSRTELVLVAADRIGRLRGRLKLRELARGRHASPAAARGWLACRGERQLVVIDARSRASNDAPLLP
jgi:hypothetical protein